MKDRIKTTVLRHWKIITLTAINTIDHNVGRNAASLAYYLLFALFPLLLFISNLLGRLDINIASVILYLQRFLPRDVMELLETYLNHVSHTSSQSLMWFSLVFTIWFPMRAARGLMDDVRRAYQLPKPKKPILYALRQLLCTLVILFAILLTLILSILGRKVLEFLFSWIPILRTWMIPDIVIRLWNYLRFLLLGVIMYAVLAILYAASMDRRLTQIQLRPGVIFALIAWMSTSICFSFYVENFANYSVIYGTLGAVIVLLLWLYLTAYILIMGAEFNAALHSIRADNSCSTP